MTHLVDFIDSEHGEKKEKHHFSKNVTLVPVPKKLALKMAVMSIM